MNKSKLIAILLLLVLLPAQVAQAAKFTLPYELKPVEPTISAVSKIVTEKEDYFAVNRSSYTHIFKDSAGYDTLYAPDGSILVHSQRYTVEYLSNKLWKQIGTPYSVTKTDTTVTRHYTDYLNTEIQVIYDIYSGKTDVVIDSAEDRVYRVHWSLDGIAGTVTHNTSSVKFTNGNEYVVADWSDATKQKIEVSDLTISDSANGKKLDIYFTIGLLKAGERFILDPILYDSHNAGSYSLLSINSVHPSSTANSAVGQSFQITEDQADKVLTQIIVTLFKVGSPNGYLICSIYDHDGGTYGTTGEPTGDPLFNSTNAVQMSTLTGNYANITFNFNIPTNSLLEADYYAFAIVAVNATTLDTSNYVRIATDSTTLGHSGCTQRYTSSAWYAISDRDTIFYMYIQDQITIKDIKFPKTVSIDVPIFFNISVLRTSGFDEPYIVLYFNSSSEYEIFTYYDGFGGGEAPPHSWANWGEDSTVVTVNDSYKIFCFNFALNSSAATGLGSFTIFADDYPAIGNVTVYTEGTYYSYATVSKTDCWTFVDYNWYNAINLLNSLFEFFGISNYVSSILSIVSTLGSYFANSIAYFLLAVVQMYRLISSITVFWLSWFTRMITFFISLGTIVVKLLNGTQTGVGTLIDIWSLFEVSEWIDFIPVAIFITWVESVDRRWRQGQGWITTAWGDIQIALSITTYIIDTMSSIFDIIIEKVLGLFSYLG